MALMLIIAKIVLLGMESMTAEARAKEMLRIMEILDRLRAFADKFHRDDDDKPKPPIAAAVAAVKGP